jgi:hypothetical protein
MELGSAMSIPLMAKDKMNPLKMRVIEPDAYLKHHAMI